jgi:adenosine/AMP kinase
MKVGCGHTFWIFLDKGFPVSVLNAIKIVPEVARIFCATSNPLQVVVAVTDKGRGVSAVIDGQAPLGIETDKDRANRREFLRTIGYKR